MLHHTTLTKMSFDTARVTKIAHRWSSCNDVFNLLSYRGILSNIKLRPGNHTQTQCSESEKTFSAQCRCIRNVKKFAILPCFKSSGNRSSAFAIFGWTLK